MQISKKATPEAIEVDAATGRPVRPFDVALVVVHGMGDAYTSQILLEWAEPLLGRLEWLARDPLIGGDREGFGVVINESTLAGATPVVTATVTFPKRTGEQGAKRTQPAGEPEKATRRIAILEARWEDAFVPLDRRAVFKWAVRFLWRAFRRMLRLFAYTLVFLPWYVLLRHRKSPTTSLLRFPLDLIVDGIRLVASTLMFAVIWVFIVALGLVLTPILPLLSPLLLIPAFDRLARGSLDTIVESIGDVTAWRERPVRASAMRMVVRNALTHASRLVKDDVGEVHVLAHSQGAAVATYTLLEELVPDALKVRRLTTVGAAVVLLGQEKWPGRNTPYRPIEKWVALNAKLPPKKRLVWQNYWATWDPFSAGPIADRPEELQRRWRASYFPELATIPDGPEEHAVHNTNQPFLDHSLYYDNVTEVIEPTALNLLGDDYPRQPEAVEYVETRLSVIAKKSLAANFLAAVVIAAIVPGLPPVSEAFAWVLRTISVAVGWVVDRFNGDAPAPDFEQNVGWLRRIDPDTGVESLSTLGWIVAAGLILAVLVWLNQVLHRVILRSRVWERCPADAPRWLAWTMIPRSLYALAAAAAVFFGIALWPDWTGCTDEQRAGFLWLTGLVLLLLTAIAVFQPRFAPAPVVVPGTMPPAPPEGTSTEPAAEDEGVAAAPQQSAPSKASQLLPTGVPPRAPVAPTTSASTGVGTNLAMNAAVDVPTKRDAMRLGRAMKSADYRAERDERRRATGRA
ncbi:hypothetical protein [Agromyces humatus]|uniref:Uncharacterized protein n=1 Tax=Agromyces humatus TaxID=279573 RepID=A0ABP4WP85_9MICO|nr:hypothetical protein [Agromyces humatus]